MLIKMEFTSLAVEPGKNTPVIVLREAGGERTLSVPVGPLEVGAIAIDSLDVATDKPLPVDLTRSVMEALGGRLERVVIGKPEADSLGASLQIVRGGSAFLVECPVGSAVALAHRCGAPVFVHERTLDERRDRKPGSPEEDLRQRISGLDTLEFGTYHLE